MSENKTAEQILSENLPDRYRKYVDYNKLIKCLELYANQFKYDFSKECKCDYSGGETWCCNACGRPITNQTTANQKPKVTEEEAYKIFDKIKQLIWLEKAERAYVVSQPSFIRAITNLSLSPNGEIKSEEKKPICENHGKEWFSNSNEQRFCAAIYRKK